MGDHRQTERREIVYETDRSVLIVPVREAIMFVLICLVCGVLMLWSMAIRFNQIEQRIEDKWTTISMYDREQDAQMMGYREDLTDIVKVTVGMWGKYIEETSDHGETENGIRRHKGDGRDGSEKSLE